jgi:hypothetical protein
MATGNCKWWSIIGLISCLASLSCVLSLEWKHHDNQELVSILEEVHFKCPNITRVYTLSETSVAGNPLVLIEFTDLPGIHEMRKFFPS